MIVEFSSSGASDVDVVLQRRVRTFRRHSMTRATTLSRVGVPCRGRFFLPAADGPAVGCRSASPAGSRTATHVDVPVPGRRLLLVYVTVYVEARAQTRPRDRMARSGKLRHVDAALADEYSGDGLTDPRHDVSASTCPAVVAKSGAGTAQCVVGPDRSASRATREGGGDVVGIDGNGPGTVRRSASMRWAAPWRRSSPWPGASTVAWSLWIAPTAVFARPRRPSVVARSCQSGQCLRIS